MIEERTLQERVRTQRLFEQQWQAINHMPSWDVEMPCEICGEFRNHLVLAFEEAPCDPNDAYLRACETCRVVTFPDLPMREKVRQIRAWHQWAERFGTTVPVWLLLLPGEPRAAGQ